MFKIEYERADGKSAWLKSEYRDPEDADKIAKHLLSASERELVRTTVIEQAGYVYSQHVNYPDTITLTDWSN
jgi:hypothetical protein